ncbi:MAG: Rieske 2Fe-2S domain-containing protein [Ginsengibacter sp.]
MDRKEFIKRGCRTCLLGTAALMLPSLTGCSPAAFNVYKTTVTDNTIDLPLSLFEKNNLQIVRPQGWQFDIAVQKKPGGNYTAILMVCTHMENQLTASQNGFDCSLHGSRFNAEGDVIKGPAEYPLKKFSTTIQHNKLILSI